MAAIWCMVLGTMTDFIGMTNAALTDHATVQLNLQASEWEVLDEECEEKTDTCTEAATHIEEDQGHKDRETEESENKEEILEEPESENQENTSDSFPSNDKQEGQAEESITESSDQKEGSNEAEHGSSSIGDKN